MRSEAMNHFAFSYVARWRLVWLPCGRDRETTANVPVEKLSEG
jgi:hypothetical protein